MYTKGSEEIKKWMLALQESSFLLKEESMGSSSIEDEDDERPKSPFDVLESLRDILNSDLKDPDDDQEIQKLLKKSFKELESYMNSIEDDDDDEEEKEDEESQNFQQQQQQPVPNTGVNPNPQGLGDIGANTPGDMEMSMGGGMGMAPPGGGQI